MRIFILTAMLAGCSSTSEDAKVVAPEPQPASHADREAGDKEVVEDDASPPATPPMEALRGLPADPVTKPNVVVVIGCTVRRDQMTPYGGHIDATPFLAARAAEGTLFTDMLAAGPWTRVGSTALLTGVHPVNIGMVEPTNKRNDRVLPDQATTIAEHMHSNGYFTVGATANPNLNPEFGFGQGFDSYQELGEARWSGQGKLRGKQIAQGIGEILTNRPDKTAPVYARVMFIEAHAPRSAKPEEITPFSDGVPERVATYRATLRHFDDAVAYLVEVLAEQGLDASNTTFVVVSDHGEGMTYPSHHGHGHGNYFGSSTIQLPWIAWGAGVAKGHRIGGLASQVDLLPTLIGHVGIEGDLAVDGMDWSHLLQGEGHMTTRERAWADTWFRDVSRAAVFTVDRHCQWDFGSSQKQTRKGKFVPGCFDRINDPLSATRLDDDDLMQELKDWRQARTAQMTAVGNASDVTVTDEVKRQLEMLGYVDE